MRVFVSLFLKQQQKPTAVLFCLKARHAVVTCAGLIWVVMLLLESYLGILGPPSPPALLSFWSVRGVLSLVFSKLLTNGQLLRRLFPHSTNVFPTPALRKACRNALFNNTLLGSCRFSPPLSGFGLG